MPVTYTLQQSADIETLLLTWYRMVRELKEKDPTIKIKAHPSGKQLLFWIETYGPS